MSRGELAAELSRCEDLLRRWVLKAWVRGTETLKHAEIVASLEARLRDRACRVDGAFDDAGSTLALRRERDEYAAALTGAASDAAEARADAAERGRSGGGYELDRLRDENERLKRRAPPSDTLGRELAEEKALRAAAEAQVVAAEDEKRVGRRNEPRQGRASAAKAQQDRDACAKLRAEAESLRRERDDASLEARGARRELELVGARTCQARTEAEAKSRVSIVAKLEATIEETESRCAGAAKLDATNARVARERDDGAALKAQLAEARTQKSTALASAAKDFEVKFALLESDRDRLRSLVESERSSAGSLRSELAKGKERSEFLEKRVDDVAKRFEAAVAAQATKDRAFGEERQKLHNDLAIAVKRERDAADAEKRTLESRQADATSELEASLDAARRDALATRDEAVEAAGRHLESLRRAEGANAELQSEASRAAAELEVARAAVLRVTAAEAEATARLEAAAEACDVLRAERDAARRERDDDRRTSVEAVEEAQGEARRAEATAERACEDMFESLKGDARAALEAKRDADDAAADVEERYAAALKDTRDALELRASTAERDGDAAAARAVGRRRGGARAALDETGFQLEKLAARRSARRAEEELRLVRAEDADLKKRFERLLTDEKALAAEREDRLASSVGKLQQTESELRRVERECAARCLEDAKAKADDLDLELKTCRALGASEQQAAALSEKALAEKALAEDERAGERAAAEEREARLRPRATRSTANSRSVARSEKDAALREVEAARLVEDLEDTLERRKREHDATVENLQSELAKSLDRAVADRDARHAKDTGDLLRRFKASKARAIVRAGKLAVDKVRAALSKLEPPARPTVASETLDARPVCALTVEGRRARSPTCPATSRA
ncbi:hypothetical protein JL720_4757 [Aureococcus anophagefferens]|nr:hypothetical protein JL720_4757 [Aureococcus anophagefferens]